MRRNLLRCYRLQLVSLLCLSLSHLVYGEVLINWFIPADEHQRLFGKNLAAVCIALCLNGHGHTLKASLETDVLTV